MSCRLERDKNCSRRKKELRRKEEDFSSCSPPHLGWFSLILNLRYDFWKLYNCNRFWLVLIVCLTYFYITTPLCDTVPKIRKGNRRCSIVFSKVVCCVFENSKYVFENSMPNLCLRWGKADRWRSQARLKDFSEP